MFSLNYDLEKWSLGITKKFPLEDESFVDELGVEEARDDSEELGHVCDMKKQSWKRRQCDQVYAP